MEKSRDTQEVPLQAVNESAKVYPAELEEVPDSELKAVSGGLDGSSKDAAY